MIGHITRDEVTAVAMLQMLSNPERYLCEKCGDPLLGHGHELAEWQGASNRKPRLCEKCIKG